MIKAWKMTMKCQTPSKFFATHSQTLDGKHPELVAKIAEAMQSSRGKDSQLPAVEAAFREAAVSLVPVDKDAAETLFTIAEILAQIPTAIQTHR